MPYYNKSNNKMKVGFGNDGILTLRSKKLSNKGIQYMNNKIKNKIG